MAQASGIEWTDATWNRYPEKGVLVFEDKQDIVISSRPRDSHGKGVRAIATAAFNLALLRLCAREGRPFPRVVLIDSPLVLYREPDTDEGAFPHDVKGAFYEAVAAAFGDVQVIILENDDPPDSVRATANVVAFTGTNQWRGCFLPQVAGIAYLARRSRPHPSCAPRRGSTFGAGRAAWRPSTPTRTCGSARR